MQERLSRSTLYAHLAGGLAVALGAVVLVGWYLHEPALIQVSPAFVPMQYNTALGFALGGAALLLVTRSLDRWAPLAGGIVLAIGVLTLIEYVFGVELKIDQLLMEHYIDKETSHPGRMAPNTALCFSLTGAAALIAVFGRDRRRTPGTVAVIGAVTVSLGITAFAGYVVGVEGAYGWGQLTRMAIHTAAGFVVLGAGVVCYAWSEERRCSGVRYPPWLPAVIGITGATITFALWQALDAQERRTVEMLGPEAANFADDGLVIFGALLTVLLFIRTYRLAKVREEERRARRDPAPMVVIVMGVLLSISAFSLLNTNFRAGVKNRFNLAVEKHVSGLEFGVESYLETLHHIRSGFAASTFLDRDEFDILVSRDAQRFDGIMAIAWLPKVPASERQAMEAAASEQLGIEFFFGDRVADGSLVPARSRPRHFPAYYIVPLEPNGAHLGLDMAGIPGRMSTLMKAVEIDGPVVSSKLEQFRPQDKADSVFIALPIYHNDQRTGTPEERESALKGFAIIAVEIGPMIEAILDRYTQPAGLAMTFEDAQGDDASDFMYHHSPRLGPDITDDDAGSGKDYWLSTTATMDFADRQWRIHASTGNEELFPRTNPNYVWLSVALLVLTFGLARYLQKAGQRERERARMVAYQAALIDSIPNPMFVKDVDAVFTACNKAYQKAFGVRWREFVGKTVLDLDYLPEDFRKAAQQKDLDLIREGGLSQEEITLRYADGETHDVMYLRTTVDMGTGESAGLIGLLIDISDLKALQNDLVDARETAEQANQAKSAFLANMSHELRTPMNAILGYSEMLAEEAEDLELEDFIPDLKKINQAGTHLLALINDVLDLSKIESGRMEAYAEDIDIAAMLDSVVSTAQPLVAKNDNRLELDFGDNLGAAHQDLTKVRQSLFNLLSNAAKFTNEGAITIEARRTSEEGVDWLSFAVRDTGVGIAEDKLENVFEEFTQADGSTTRNYGGTGLGLAISRRFCRLLGGDLTLESEVGVGSVFTIRIPAILPGTESVDEQPEEALPSDEELASLGETATASTVLVIDDDAEAREIIERFLEKDGFNVVTASGGAEGLRIAHAVSPMAITLDVMMPDMDGWAVLRALKSDPNLRDIPVLMLTMIDDKSKGYALGATEYLTKPVDRDTLHDMLARFRGDADTATVLLVEDDDDARAMTARVLDRSGWAVVEARDGREGLDRMEESVPQVVLLDLMMPVMDGFEFLDEMRRHEEWSEVPVVVLTAKDMTEEDRRRLDGRVERVFSKASYTHAQLTAFVRGLLEGKRPD
jgi:PAS domain S-box-containing protein